MSYILEALKKAQAERQLGSAPTIHSMPLHAAGPGPGAHRPTLAIALAAGALLAAGAATLLWRQSGAPAGPAAAPPPAAVGAGVAAGGVPAPQPAAVLPAAPLATPPQSAAPAPLASAAPVTARARPRAAVPPPAAASARPAPAKPERSASLAAARTEPAGEAAAAPEETVRTLRELPEAIQREVPQVAIGGYIYSRNPADRLLLIDKILRREGEEVAPGLTLERLLPKGAVMNYRGYRYRVAY